MPKLQSLTALLPDHPTRGSAQAKKLLSLVAKRPSITSLGLPLCILSLEDIFPADRDLSHIDDLQIRVPNDGNCGVPADIEQFISAVNSFKGVKVFRVKNTTYPEAHEWRVKVEPVLAEHCPELNFEIG